MYTEFQTNVKITLILLIVSKISSDLFVRTYIKKIKISYQVDRKFLMAEIQECLSFILFLRKYAAIPQIQVSNLEYNNVRLCTRIILKTSNQMNAHSFWAEIEKMVHSLSGFTSLCSCGASGLTGSFNLSKKLGQLKMFYRGAKVRE
jgi:hypothetical protein